MSTSLLVGIAGTLALNLLFGRGGSSSSVQEGPRLQDLTVQASTYGQYIPKLFGKARLAGNLIWALPLKEHRFETTERVGKGGRQQVTQVYYRYTATFAVGLCEGVVDGMGKIWIDGKLYRNVNNFAGNLTESELFNAFWNKIRGGIGRGKVRFYNGSETQTADPAMAAAVGAANAPAFRGLCYIVFEDLPLDNYGNRIGQVNVELIRSATKTTGKRLILTNTGNVLPSDKVRRSMTSFNNGISRIYADGIDRIELVGMNGTYYGEAKYDNNVDKFSSGRGYNACIGILNGFKLLAYGDGSKALNDATDPPLMLPFSGNQAIAAGNISHVKGNSYDDIFKRIESNHALFAMGLIISENGQRGLAFFGTNVATPATFTTWYLFYLNGSATPIIERSGDASSLVSSSQFPFGNGSWVEVVSGTIKARNFGTPAAVVNAFVEAGMIENDYTHFWSFNFTTRACFKLEADGTIGKVFDTIPNALSQLTNTIFADNGICIIYSAQVPSIFGAYYIEINSRDNFYTSGVVTVGSVVTQICIDSGIDSGDIDTTELTEAVEGYIIGRNITGRGAIEQLSSIYQFDGVESDYKLKFPLRASGSYTSLPEADLAVTLSTLEIKEAVKVTKKLETELPKRVNVNYLNQSKDYDIDNQHYERIETISEREITVDVPVVLTASRAKQAAEIILNSMWKERFEYTASVAQKYIKLDPSDKITLNKGALAFNARIVESESTREGVINLKGLGTEQFIYSSSASSSTEAVESNTESYPGGCDPILLDIAMLRDVDTSPGYYAALGSYFSTWTGGILLQSDDGVEYQNLVSVEQSPARGYITATIAAPSSLNVRDYGTVINVKLYNGTLSGITEEEFLSNINIAIVGDEIIAFKNATLQGDGSYNVSELIRGVRGTESFASTHAVNDKFIFLSGGGIERINIEQSIIGQTRYYRSYSFGAGLPSAESIPLIVQSIGLKPYSVTHDAATRDGSNNLTLNWVARTRAGGQWRDGVEAYQEESPESYSIDILDPTQTTVVRTLTSSTPTVAYTAAEQTTDGYTPGDEVYGNIYMLNAIFGRGYAKYFAL